MDLTALKAGDIFKNPKKGTSEITKITDVNIYYKRGQSIIALPIAILQDVCSHFACKLCSSSDLKKYKPEIFSTKQNGHDCNCTFLFLIAQKMELIQGGILGKGVTGDPYYVEFD